MCLKPDATLLQYTHQFQCFITTCPCTAEIYQQMLQSNCLNGNDLMFLFNWGWSHLTNKLTLRRSLNLFASEANIEMIKVY